MRSSDPGLWKIAAEFSIVGTVQRIKVELEEPG
jgi:hypothetical protein